MDYFKNCKTIEDLKTLYKKLAMENHPDKGGKTEIMQQINNQYDLMFDKLKNIHNSDLKNENNQFTESSDEFREIISKITNLDGLVIEICGKWIWVSGNTRIHKDTLKNAGFLWASKKLMWYWRREEDKNFSKKRIDMGEIRLKYGSNRVDNSARAYCLT